MAVSKPMSNIILPKPVLQTNNQSIEQSTQWTLQSVQSISPPTLSELVDAAVTDPIHESCIDADNRGDLEDTLNILSELVTVDGS
jgi:hypothetical protein